MIEQHYTPREVAERLHVSEDTIYRAMQRQGSSRLASVRPPGTNARRIPHSALEAWLAGDAPAMLDAPVIEMRRRR